jgi:hypothetical protein
MVQDGMGDIAGKTDENVANILTTREKDEQKNKTKTTARKCCVIRIRNRKCSIYKTKGIRLRFFNIYRPKLIEAKSSSGTPHLKISLAVLASRLLTRKGVLSSRSGTATAVPVLTFKVHYLPQTQVTSISNVLLASRMTSKTGCHCYKWT